MMMKKTICDRSEYSAIKLIFESHMLLNLPAMSTPRGHSQIFSLFNR